MEGKRGMGAQRSDVPCLKLPSKWIAQVGIKGGRFIWWLYACLMVTLYWYKWHCNCSGYSTVWARSWVCPEHSRTALRPSETMSNPCGCLFNFSLSCLRFKAITIVVIQCEGRWDSHCHSGILLCVFSFLSLLPMLCVPQTIHFVIRLPFWEGKGHARKFSHLGRWQVYH